MVKILSLVVLAAIAYQDLSDRKVYTFVFPVLIGLLGYLHYQSVEIITFISAICINIAMLTIIIGLLYLYTIVKIKRPFFEEVFGMGDVLFFVALAIGFPTMTFIILFVFSLIFSLLVWLVLKKRAKHDSVPLAGYMSIFFGVLFIMQWVTNSLTLYLI
ncbi:hypothetical protein [Aquimarina aquimarini]|uniref:hypothetical protein n=1 Tax=Aquimarina aquimarini TaxID=1191734 RepID=UPI00131F0760|nr:hypothetical protein [Aquimarina aquimarini]